MKVKKAIKIFEEAFEWHDQEGICNTDITNKEAAELYVDTLKVRVLKKLKKNKKG